MRVLNDAAKEKNLCFVNEVGLDPGIDHSMSHALVDDYKASNESFHRRIMNILF